MSIKQQLGIIIGTFLLTLTCLLVTAQVPDSTNYQAVVRKSNGNVMANQQVSVRFTIQANGSQVYQETHQNVQTNQYGLINLAVGSQNPSAFDAIQWSQGNHELQVEIDRGEGFITMGNQSFRSVPYSFYTDLADSVTMPIQSLQNVSSSNVSNGQVLKWNGSEWAPASDAGGTSYNAGNGITINGNTIVNTARDTTVSISGSGATSVSGTYPSFTVSSTDSVNVYSGGTGIGVTGTTINAQNTNAIWNANNLQGNPIPSATPNDNQILKWNASTQSWELTNDNVASGGGAVNTGSSINGDGSQSNPLVVNPGNASGQVLKWDGTNWNAGKDSVKDGDADPTNEIQTLSLNGQELTISSGDTVTLPSGGATYTAGTGINITGNNVIENTGDTDASDDITNSTPAGGDLAGSYPAPTVTAIQGNIVSGSSPSTNQVLKWNGTSWAPSQDENTTYSGGSGINVTGGTISNTGDTDASDDITNSTSAGGDLSNTYPNPTVSALQGNSLSASSPADGEVLKWDANTNSWVSGTDNVSSGGGSVNTTARIDGDGSTSNKLDIAQQGANDGQVLKWDGSKWTPDTDSVINFTTGPGILISGDTIVNQGDKDPSDDITKNSTAGGDLSGFYPDPVVSGIQGNPISSTANPSQGEVLGYDGSEWKPVDNSDDDWFQLGNKVYTIPDSVGIGTSPITKLHVVDGEDVLFGQKQTGFGKRLMWDYSNGAFRAGRALGKEWNPDSIGDFSVAFGLATKASAPYSSAFGQKSKALGNSAFAAGSESIANNYSVAIGDQDTATGSSSLAIGSNNRAKTNGSGLIGQGNIAKNAAYGGWALGIDNVVTGTRAFAFGEEDTATGQTSMAIGHMAKATNDEAISLGISAKATGQNAIAIGTGVTAQSQNSVVVGQYNEVSGSKSSSNPTDPQFVVGNGSAGSRSNAMTVLKNGVTVADSSLAVESPSTATMHFSNTPNEGQANGVDLNSNLDNGLIVEQSNNEGAGMYFDGDVAALWSPGDAGSDIFRIYDEDNFINASPKPEFVVEDDGNVGIGTPDPAKNLHIKETGSSSDAIAALDAPSGASSTLEFRASGSFRGSIGYSDQSSQDYIYMYQGGNAMIAKNGQVTIGSNNDPDNALTVDGVANFKDGASIGTDSSYSDDLRVADANGDNKASLQIGFQAGDELRIGTHEIRSDGSSGLEVEADIKPESDNTYSLGSGSYRWREVYSAQGVTTTSDRRSKKEIETLDYGLKELMDLSPVAYKMKNNDHPVNKKSLGLVAQEVSPIIDEVVKTHHWTQKEENGEWVREELDRYGINYGEIVPVLINSVQEQQQIIDDQQEALDKQRQQNDELQKKNKELEQEISRIKQALQNEGIDLK